MRTEYLKKTSYRQGSADYTLRGVPEQFLIRDENDISRVTYMKVPNENSSDGFVLVSASAIEDISFAVNTVGDRMDELYNVKLDTSLKNISGMTSDGVMVTMTPERLIHGFSEYQKELFEGLDIENGVSSFSVKDAPVIEIPASFIMSEGYMDNPKVHGMGVRFGHNAINVYVEHEGERGTLTISRNDFLTLPQKGEEGKPKLDSEFLNKTDKVKVRLTKPMYLISRIEGRSSDEALVSAKELKAFFGGKIKEFKNYEPKTVAVSPDVFMGENISLATGEMLDFLAEGNFEDIPKTSNYCSVLVFKDDVDGVVWNGNEIDTDATNAQKALFIHLDKPYFQVEDGREVALLSAGEIADYYTEKYKDLQALIPEKPKQTARENVYIYDISEKLIHNLPGRNMVSVGIPDKNSSTGFGSFLARKEDVYPAYKQDGSPKMGKKSVKVGNLGEDVDYQIRDKNGKYVKTPKKAEEIKQQFLDSKNDYIKSGAWKGSAPKEASNEPKKNEAQMGD